MQARVSQEGEVVIVHLSGRVDIETADAFRNSCLQRLNQSKVVFNFQDLSFVGSTGILPFLETMQAFKKANQLGFKFSNVGIEFRRLFGATPLHDIQIFENFQLATRSFSEPSIPAIPHEQPISEENLISFETLFATSDLTIAEDNEDVIDENEEDQKETKEI